MGRNRMLKILVNATALNSRGGFTVLKNFLSELVEENKYLSNNKIKVYILVSVKELQELQNDCISVYYYPHPKKNLMLKWWFENRVIKNIIKEFEIGAYLSLQNVGLRKIDVRQYCLIHQPIPFSSLRANEIELKNYIKYKVLLNYFYTRNMKYIDTIFVQTNWMRNAIISKYGYKGRIEVILPPVKSIMQNNSDLSIEIVRKLESNNIKFLYVTNTEKYKNNANLIKAIELYNRQFYPKISLFLTIDGNCSENIKYVGKIKYESIFSLYKSMDALIFPSLTETLGLPLLEAQEAGLNILAASEPYAYEICPEGTIYFNPRDVNSIVTALNDYVNGIHSNKTVFDRSLALPRQKGSYLDYIKIIHEDFISEV